MQQQQYQGAGYPTSTVPYSSRQNTESQMPAYSMQEANTVHGGVYSNRQQSYQNTFSGQAHMLGHPDSVTEDFYEGQVIGEEVIETKITVPVRRQYEETIMKQKIIEVPETVVRTRLEEETKTVQQKVVKVARPKINVVKKIVEVPVVEEVPEEQIQDVYVDNIVYVDQPVDVMEPVYVPQVVEVEVPRYVEQVMERHVPVPVYVDDVQVIERKQVTEIQAPPIIHEIEIPEYKRVEIVETVSRNVPVAVEHVIHQKYELPELENEYEEVPYPVYAARFCEIAVPAEYLTDQSILECDNLRRQLYSVTSSAMPSLCVLEDMMERVRRFRVEHVTDPEVIRQRLARQIEQLQRSSSNPQLAGMDLTPMPEHKPRRLSNPQMAKRHVSNPQVPTASHRRPSLTSALA
eukprot:Protomagalhaensia_sp_Gyna_25__521@NODE_1245_length_2027_cov_166_025151_g993_i0_p1_GENE_NODE_1245_length_2027_cov_166_025151_g993_i0NODE_1245_length_2027_cov_166_025151_g993_i0_p1_ORF_typecomplete_len405_score93_70_NODE_1245_length_2027_cov_166_025151_g993_i05731787